MKANRQVKDSVFSLYLTEDTRRLVEVYNAVQGTDYPLDTPVEINTLQGVLYKDRYNDISFILDNRYIVFNGHQSTINENIPVRAAIYAGRLYEKVLSRENMYREKLIQIPAPEFVVFYNGNKPYPQETLLRLSDAFEGVPHINSMELVVKVINICQPENNPFLEKCQPLREYSIFINQIYKYTAEGMKLEDAIHKAVLYCKEHNIMQPFLLKHASEVENMLFSEWNLDDALRIAREEAREEGRKEAREEVREEVREECRKEVREEALEEGLEKGLEKGMATLIETLAEMGNDFKAILDVIQKKYSLSPESALEKMKKYYVGA